MFSGFGPRVPLRAFPAGAVTATPVSSFVTAGINQTIHRLYLDIKVEMRIVVPLASAKLPVSTRVALIEDIIVGAVPSWYLAPVGLVGGFDQLAGREQPDRSSLSLASDSFSSKNTCQVHAFGYNKHKSFGLRFLRNHDPFRGEEGSFVLTWRRSTR